MITKINLRTGKRIELFAAKSDKGYSVCCSEFDGNREIRSIDITNLSTVELREMIYSLQLLIKDEIDTTHEPGEIQPEPKKNVDTKEKPATIAAS